MTHVVKVFVVPLGTCVGDNTWENAVKGIASRVRRRSSIDARFETVTLFSKEFFAHPDIVSLVKTGEGRLPIVTVDGTVIQTGGKLNERVIREALQQVSAAEGIVQPD